MATCHLMPFRQDHQSEQILEMENRLLVCRLLSCSHSFYVVHMVSVYVTGSLHFLHLHSLGMWKEDTWEV